MDKHLRDRWSYDFQRKEWCVNLTPEKRIYVNDLVKVKFTNGVFEGRVKQVAGFGMKETRDVISVLFPGHKKGTKISINQIIY